MSGPSPKHRPFPPRSSRVRLAFALTLVVMAILSPFRLGVSPTPDPWVRPEPAPLGRAPFDPVAIEPAPPVGPSLPGGVRSPINAIVNDRTEDPLGHVQSEVTMAVRGDTVVIGWNDAAGYGGAASLSGHGTSTDRGVSWRDGGEVPDGPLTEIAGDPSVVVLPDGTWVFGSIDLGNDDGVAIHRGRFVGKKLEWESPLLYLRDGGEALDKPYLAADPASGALYLAYVNWSQNRGEVSRSDDGGRTWSEPLVVYGSSRATGYYPTASVNGGLYVAWTDRVGAPGTTHYVRYSADGGRSWSDPPHPLVVLEPDAHHPPLCSNRGVNATFLDLAVDRGIGPDRGRVYAVWTDGHPGTFDVFLSASTDGARSWSVPLRLNDNPNAATTESFWPVVDVAPDGRVTVGWYDRRHGHPSSETLESLCDFYVVQSRDGGVSWGTNRRMSTLSVAWCGVPADLVPNFGDYVDLVTTDRSVMATWADARAGDPDVIFGRIDDRRELAIEGVGVNGRALTGTGTVWTIVDEVEVTLSDREGLTSVVSLAAGLLATPAEGIGVLDHGGGRVAGDFWLGADRVREAGFRLERRQTGSVHLEVRLNGREIGDPPGVPARARYGLRSNGVDDVVIEGFITFAGPGDAEGDVRVSGHLSLDGIDHPPARTWSVEQEMAVSESRCLLTRTRVHMVEGAPPMATAPAVGIPVSGSGNPFPVATIGATATAAGGPVTLRVEVSRDTPVRVRIYDASGRRVRELSPRSLSAGRHAIPFDGRDGGGRVLPSGLYFLELVTDHLRARGKLVIR